MRMSCKGGWYSGGSGIYFVEDNAREQTDFLAFPGWHPTTFWWCYIPPKRIKALRP